MKKLIALGLLVFITVSAYSERMFNSDLEFGFVYGLGSANYDEANSIVQINKVSASGPGFYIDATTEFNKYFGMFADLNLIFPTKTSIEAKINGVSVSVDDYLKVNFEMNELIGFCGIIPVTDNFKLRLGGGLDIGLMISSMETTVYRYNVSIKELDIMFGIGIKAMGVFMITEKVGLNFGINGDFFFFFFSRTATNVT